MTITEIKVINTLGTGAIYQVRIDFPGIKTPQTYPLNISTSTDGTQAGTGLIVNMGVKVNIPVPSGVSEVTLKTKQSVASQTWVGAVRWEGP